MSCRCAVSRHEAFQSAHRIQNRNEGVQNPDVRLQFAWPLLTAINPESGTISYTYDDGSLASRTDARGVSVSYTYEALGRNTTKNCSDANAGSQVLTYYIYDIAGRIAAKYSDATLPEPETSYVFEELGNVDDCYDYLPFGRMLTANDNAVVGKV